MRALTVQQPWAWAIALGAKRVENRTQRWTYRGPLAIHAGARVSARGIEDVPRLMVEDGWGVLDGCREWMLSELEQGAIIAVADLADVHTATPDCCDSRWAEQSYEEHGGRTRRDLVHLVLDDARALTDPIPCSGRLGLWTPPDHVLQQLSEPS